jgi:hypothetical protein
VTLQERTLQRRDPLAAVVGRPTSYVAAVGIPLYAIVMTWAARDDIANPLLAVLAIGMCVASGIILLHESSPLRAPMRRRVLVSIMLPALGALVLSAASTWSQNDYLGDDWAGPASGLYLVALAPYRPAKEIAIAGVITAAVAGAVASVGLGFFVSVGPDAAFLIVAVTPVLALALGSAAFTDVLVRSLDRWGVRARSSFTTMLDERNESIARSVQQDRVTIINKEIVPFLAALVDGAPVTDEVRNRARTIAEHARLVMAAEANLTWLQRVAEGSGRADPATMGVVRATVHDESRLALHMTTDERTAVRAFLSAVNAHVSFIPRNSSIAIVGDRGRCLVELRVAMESADRALHGELAPYLAVLRVVFSDLELDNGDAHLTLRFSYEQR